MTQPLFQLAGAHADEDGRRQPRVLERSHADLEPAVAVEGALVEEDRPVRGQPQPVAQAVAARWIDRSWPPARRAVADDERPPDAVAGDELVGDRLVDRDDEAR